LIYLLISKAPRKESTSMFPKSGAPIETDAHSFSRWANDKKLWSVIIVVAEKTRFVQENEVPLCVVQRSTILIKFTGHTLVLTL
jgi:hypothetical protein